MLMMTRDESKMGSLFLKRTRRDHVPNATDRERERETEKEGEGQRVEGREMFEGES